MTDHRWSEEIVAGHPCDVFEPSRPHPQQLVLIYLHGVHLQRLVEQTPYTEQFERFGLRVIAPHTQRSWWTDRLCPEFDRERTAEQHVREFVVAEIERRWGVQPPSIGLFGTSMGGQGALRMAYKYPTLFPVVAAVSPAIDYHTRFREGDETLPLMYRNAEEARQDSALLHIHPLNWPRYQFFCCDPSDNRWWESADRLRMKLYSLGVPHECELELEGGGHGFEYYNRMAPRTIEFLAQSLDEHSRRLD